MDLTLILASLRSFCSVKLFPPTLMDFAANVSLFMGFKRTVDTYTTYRISLFLPFINFYGTPDDT